MKIETGKLKAFIKARKMSYRDLAKAADVSLATVLSAVKTDLQHSNDQTFRKIAFGLKVTPDGLRELLESDKPKPEVSKGPGGETDEEIRQRMTACINVLPMARLLPIYDMLRKAVAEEVGS